MRDDYVYVISTSVLETSILLIRRYTSTIQYISSKNCYALISMNHYLPILLEEISAHISSQIPFTSPYNFINSIKSFDASSNFKTKVKLLLNQF